MQTDQDKLEVMWKLQDEFMKLLSKKRTFPQYPVDLVTKKGQQELRTISYHCMQEIFEAIQHLKNSKEHRATNVSEFDRSNFVEELCDAQHFLIELLIMAGVTADEFFSVYVNKHAVNVDRIENGY